MKHPKVLLCLLVLLSCLHTYYWSTEFEKNSAEKTKLMLYLYTERIKSVFDKALSTADVFREIIHLHHGTLSEKSFYSFANMLYDKELYSAVAYMPKGVIKYIFPHEFNIKSLGTPFFPLASTKTLPSVKANNNETSISKSYQKIQIHTPKKTQIPTAQERVIIHVSEPVYIEKNGENIFWGFSTVMLSPFSFLKSFVKIHELEILGYEFFIFTKYNDTQFELIRTKSFIQENAQTQEIPFGKNMIYFSLYKRDEQKKMIQYGMNIFFISAILSLLFYFAFKKFHEGYMSIKEQLYNDHLTGLYNRKKIDTYLSNNKKQRKNFTLFYLDLNDFKPINDTYGHEMGDKILIAFSGRMRSIFKRETIIARIGGDEFVILLIGIITKPNALKIQQRICKAATTPFFIDGLELHISTSIGCATYPTDGKNMKTLLEYADKQMYINKKEQKENKD